MERRLPLPVGTILQGRYRVVRQLGHGGFGAVYEAADDELGLSFALKETFYASDEELRQAFRREARMLASLSHEAFPRVTHYFTEGDGCFLVMELVPGDDLDKLLSKRAAPFEQEQVLTWADQILDALEALHSSGIIHRDIKPSNLKLTPKGKIKLLDFGIAKGTLEGETELMTTVGSMAAATLQYAPLEQVLKASQQYQLMLSVVSADKVSEIMKHGTNAASDLYALAATLYQMLTKTLPADAPTRALAIWSGQKDRLIPAHEVNPLIPAKVSGILQKALEINRFERLSSAAEMRRQLMEAVKPNAANNFATPDTIKVTGTFAPPVIRQNHAPFIAQPLDPDLNTEATRWREMPKPAVNQKNSYGLYAAIIGLPLLFLLLGSIGLAVYLNLPPGGPNDPGSKTISKYEMMQTLVGHKSGVAALSYSADGKLLASSGSAGEAVLIWDASTNSLKQTFSTAASPALSPDGKYLAFAAGDAGSQSLSVRQMITGLIIELVPPSGVSFESIKISGDGNYIYYLQVDGKTGSATAWKIPVLGGTPNKLTGETSGAVFSPDSRLIAASKNSDPGKIYLTDAAGGYVKQILGGHTAIPGSSAFSPDGKLFAGGGSAEIGIWELSGVPAKQTLGLMLFFQEAAPEQLKSPKLSLKGHTNKVTKIAFSPDGKLLASGSLDQTINVWDAAGGKLLQTLTGHTGAITSIAFSPDGKTIASGSEDKTIKLWRLKN